MNRTRCLAGKVGFALCTALLGVLTGSTTYAVEISVGVAIHAESDFYEPLAPHGEWVVIGSYGRCWRPARVEAGWRPYCNGRWCLTDGGWYWVSDEPWGWATYHYGRWDMNAELGWFWVPQTVWAPAWVSWHEGGGYIGWAPLSPSGRGDVAVISPRAFVFVEQRRFLEPIRPAMVVVNNTTIINKTVINKGPQAGAIEKVAGHKIQPVQVRELRQKEEAAVVVKPETRSEAKPATAQSSKPETRSVAKPAAVQPSRQVTKPEAKSAAAQPSRQETKPEAKSAAAQPSKQVTKPEARPEANSDSKHEEKSEAKPEGERHGPK